MTKLIIGSLLLLATLGSSDPVQPHLAQAWQAQSTGDGEPGETGLESYLYEDVKGGLRAHVWDYGEKCKKIQLDTYDEFVNEYPWGTYYINW